jgi:hypothetical protein
VRGELLEVRLKGLCHELIERLDDLFGLLPGHPEHRLNAGDQGLTRERN